MNLANTASTNPAPDHDAMTQHDVMGVPGAEEHPDGPLLRLLKDRRIAFLAVGAFNTLVGLGTFAAFDRWYGHGAWQTVATLLSSHVVSTILAFFLYRYLVFRVRGHFLLDLARFWSVYLVGIGVNLLVLSLVVDGLHAPRFPTQFVLTALMAVWSWFGHDKFSFRRPKASA